MITVFSKYFLKRAAQLPVKQRERLNERLALFRQDPFNHTLHNNTLSGKYTGFRSINITGDLRAVFKQYEDLARFEDMGTHSELYG